MLVGLFAIVSLIVYFGDVRPPDPLPVDRVVSGAGVAATVADDAAAVVDAGPFAGVDTSRQTGEAPTGPHRITEFGDDVLLFTFTEECWVEVRSTDGDNLYSNLSRAGGSLQLLGQGPFRILLGYAPGVELYFNGEPVPLAPHTRNNVANLVLGQ